MVFRILDTIRKHHLTVRYASRHLFWTVPALYGYYTLYTKARASYHEGYIASARLMTAEGTEHFRQYRPEQQKKSSSSCCKSNLAVKQDVKTD
ncbi:hypothetical protein PG997_011463 [Apiospora hydei]|uniref:Uncharacterized protein n=1 Tax=Apiospora hydei TaxID=1337664 RepID=A0ABR1VJ50_9PEZI